MYHRSEGRFLSPARPFPFFPVFYVSQKLGIENLSQKTAWLPGIHSFLLRDIVVSNIGELAQGTEREGFEPPVNKSLHSSSNATPWTTRPSLLHNDYDRELAWIASCSNSIVRWVRTIESILTRKIETLSANKKFFLWVWGKGEFFCLWKTFKNNKSIYLVCKNDAPIFSHISAWFNQWIGTNQRTGLFFF